jgi:hypothetical protein
LFVTEIVKVVNNNRKPVTSSSLCKKLEGCGFSIPITAIEDSVHTFHVYKAAIGRVRRRTSTKQRSIMLVVRNCFQRCLGKLKTANRSGRSFASCFTIVGYGNRSLKICYQFNVGGRVLFKGRVSKLRSR